MEHSRVSAPLFSASRAENAFSPWKLSLCTNSIETFYYFSQGFGKIIVIVHNHIMI